MDDIFGSDDEEDNVAKHDHATSTSAHVAATAAPSLEMDTASVIATTLFRLSPPAQRKHWQTGSSTIFKTRLCLRQRCIFNDDLNSGSNDNNSPKLTDFLISKLKAYVIEEYSAQAAKNRRYDVSLDVASNLGTEDKVREAIIQYGKLVVPGGIIALLVRMSEDRCRRFLEHLHHMFIDPTAQRSPSGVSECGRVATIPSIAANKRAAALATATTTAVQLTCERVCTPLSRAGVCLICFRRPVIQMNMYNMPGWKQQRLHDVVALQREQKLLESVTVALSSEEMEAGEVSAFSHRRAVTSLRDNGLVVMKGLFSRSKDQEQVRKWRQAALKDLDKAMKKLKERGIDLLHPGEGSSEPQSYNELAMREDFRLDLRNGEHMKVVIQSEEQVEKASERSSRRMNGNSNNNNNNNNGDDDHRHHAYNAGSSSSARQEEEGVSLRAKACVLSIVQEAFTSQEPAPHRAGNFGRWNFDEGGPDAPLGVKKGTMGSVISLPRAADQAVHADCCHLFDHMQLPPHYINLFIPSLEHHHEPLTSSSLAISSDGFSTASSVFSSSSLSPSSSPSSSSPDLCGYSWNFSVGQTGFAIGTHKLAISAQVTAPENRAALEELIVRPHLQFGDCLLFDCRTLHFGLANQSHRFPSAGDEGRATSDSKTITAATAGGGGSDGGGEDGGGGGDDEGGSGGIVRPLLYVNYTRSWFVDPKNWDNSEKLFDG